jgi:hypothetical protein
MHMLIMNTLLGHWLSGPTHEHQIRPLPTREFVGNAVVFDWRNILES